MAWWNPKEWFNKKPQSAPVSTDAPVVSIQDSGIWVRLDPEHPFQGLDHYSDSLSNPFPTALYVTGITPDEARIQLVGKIVDWTRFLPEQLDALEKTGSFALSRNDLQGMFR